MSLQLHLLPGAYGTGIQAICSAARANGTQPSALAVQVFPYHRGMEEPDPPVDVLLNLAFEPRAVQGPTASLYTIGFGDGTSVRRFDVPGIEGLAPGPSIGLNGSYASLGCDTALPPADYERLCNAAYAVRRYVSAAPRTIRPPQVEMALLIVTVSEAVRFPEIYDGINTALEDGDAYTPPVSVVKAWGGHTLTF